MRTARTRAELPALLRDERAGGRSIALVPTMGSLHEGHLELVRAARGGAEVVVLSIFVNPLQFGPEEDYERYPRDEERDLELAERESVDVAFLPSVEEMYPPGASTTVSAGPLGRVFEGAARPGHFDGVCTVVAKLFNLVRPDVAVFGQKDAQQVVVVRRMVEDLAFDLRLAIVPTVREGDGLALSSRNAYLGPEERERASVLFRALQAGRDELLEGRGPGAARARMHDELARAGVQVDYAEVVDPATFAVREGDGRALLVAAVRVGATRLIDNVVVDPRALVLEGEPA